MPTPALVPSDVSTRGVLAPSSNLFAEPLSTIRGEISVEETIDVHPLAGDLIRKLFAQTTLELARQCGRVLSETFDQDLEPLIDTVLKRLATKRT
jgi:hypothetical protein